MNILPFIIAYARAPGVSLRRFWRSLVSRYKYDVKVKSIYYSESRYQDIVQIKGANSDSYFEVMLDELLERKDIMLRMDEFDMNLIKVLVGEGSYRHNVRQPHNDLLVRPLLSIYKCIEKHFYSTYNHKEMLIVSVPKTDQQVCMSVREFINSEKLIEPIRHLNQEALSF